MRESATSAAAAPAPRAAGRYPAFKRAADATLAGAALAASAPPLAALMAALRLGHGRALQRTTLLGQAEQPFEALALALPETPFGRVLRRAGLSTWPRLWNVVRGELALIGPRPRRPDEAPGHAVGVRPGLLGLATARRLANLAFDDEATLDAEYAESQSLRRDLGILATVLLNAVQGEAPPAVPGRQQIVGVPVDNLRMQEAVAELVAFAAGTTPRLVCFVNAHCVNVARRDSAYRAVLQQADLVLPDGVGMRLAGRLLGRPVRENVNGTDLLPRLLAALAGRRVYLLGARPGVAERVGAWIGRHYPQVEVCGTHSGYFTEAEEPALVADIARRRPHLLLVAFGVPRQETWLAQHLPALGAPLSLGVGGLFDFYSGRIPRAPVFLRELGLEWAYRLVQEPGRMWRRYLIGNGVFLGHAAHAAWHERRRRATAGRER